jgi:hypothetical protein
MPKLAEIKGGLAFTNKPTDIVCSVIELRIENYGNAMPYLMFL